MSDIKFNLDDADANLIQEEVNIDTDANPMEAPPPPDDGTYRVTLKLKEPVSDAFQLKSVQSGNSAGKQYISADFNAQILAEGTRNNNKLLFGKENTLTFDGKNKLAYILLQLYGGSKNEQAATYVKSLKTPSDLAKAFKAALLKEPKLRVKTKWNSSYNAGTKEEPDYKTFKNGQANHPQNAAGVPKHINEVTFQDASGDVQSLEVTARAQIVDYLPDSN